VVGPHAPLSGAFSCSCSGPRTATTDLISRSLRSGGQSRLPLSSSCPAGSFAFEKCVPLSLQTLDTVPGASGVPQLLSSQVTRTDPTCAPFHHSPRIAPRSWRLLMVPTTCEEQSQARRAFLPETQRQWVCDTKDLLITFPSLPFRDDSL